MEKAIRKENNNWLYYIDTNKKNALLDFKKTFNELINKNIRYYKEIVVLCIGTDRATGDSLGPIIGYKLSKLPLNKNINIYGTLNEPIHAKNLKETIKNIYNKHNNPMIIAIDASLGSIEHIGHLTLGEGTLKPGAGVNKELPEIGDIFITGIVNFSGIMDIVILQNTRLSIVMQMADIVTSGIWLVLSKYTNVFAVNI